MNGVRGYLGLCLICELFGRDVSSYFQPVLVNLPQVVQNSSLCTPAKKSICAVLCPDE